jgi:hypothetical protein
MENAPQVARVEDDDVVEAVGGQNWIVSVLRG